MSYDTAHDTPFWSRSDQYSIILEEGRRRPPPSFGSPTFVWHIGLWQKRMPGDSIGDERHFKDISDENIDYLEESFDEYDQDNKRFFDEISDFCRNLQEQGCVDGAEIKTLQYTQPPKLAERNKDNRDPYGFGVCEPQSISFILWWNDKAGQSQVNGDGDTVINKQRNIRKKKPDIHDMRVKVQIQTHLDHATLTFYIDVAKPYGAAQIDNVKTVSDAKYGVRLKKVGRHLDTIRRTSYEQITSGAIDLAQLPEQHINDSDAKDLLEAANYFYQDIWDEFAAAFGLNLEEAAKEGEVFANSRGVVMSMRGLETQADLERKAVNEALRERNSLKDAPVSQRPKESENFTPDINTANTGIGKFNIFDVNSGEPNTIVKSLWPFLRRMTPSADYTDFMACGIIDWRAIYVTSLGAQSDTQENEESITSLDIPAGHIPDPSRNGDTPVRYLILTKGEPNRGQIGRFTERINSLETMRLFCLRNLETIKNASVYLRLLGRNLDGILSEWSEKRLEIDRSHPLRLSDDKIKKVSSRTEGDRRIDELNHLIAKTEKRLVDLGAELDAIGHGGAGRLSYVVSRANFYVKEFTRLYKTLKIGNIDGWIHYEQFVERNLRPTFSYVETTGARLGSLRNRLQSLTSTIQTSALIVETVATRENTQALRRIAGLLAWWHLSIVGVTVITVGTVLSHVIEQVMENGFSHWFAAVLKSLSILF